jgi:hypothetical protein
LVGSNLWVEPRLMVNLLSGLKNTTWRHRI